MAKPIGGRPRRYYLARGRGPFVTRTMLLTVELNEWLEAEADRQGHGNVSALIRSLIEAARDAPRVGERETA